MPSPHVLLYTIVVGLGAFLLFWLELMLGKEVLPYFGGTPLVWNGCLFFFQAALLLGYLFAHGLRKLVRSRPAQLVIHIVLLAVAFSLSPPNIKAEALAEPTIFGLLVHLTVSAGLPLLALATISPLLQAWFSDLSSQRSHDPYFLYAASNAGSGLGLLAYPLLFQPIAGLSQQKVYWTVGFLALGLLALLSGLLIRRASGAKEKAGAPLTGRQRVRWLVLSFVPASLLHGVTITITTDVASAPLLWAIPLLIYLGSFVVAFSSQHIFPYRIARSVLPAIIFGMAMTSVAHIILPTWALFLMHFGGFALVAVVVHRALADSRPPPTELTTFYIYLALGGALGGLFNALLAPFLFETIREYALMLVVAALIVDATTDGKRLGAMLVFGLTIVTTLVGQTTSGFADQLPGYGLVTGVVVAVVYGFKLGKGRLIAAVGLVLLFGQFMTTKGEPALVERSLFGFHRVTKDDNRGFMSYYQGTTLHGRQALDPTRQSVPLTYFHPTGPLGEILSSTTTFAKNVAVIGLGVGSMIAYADETQHWTFYEIDPVMEKIARDARLFRFLSDAKAPFDVVIGDGRLSLAATSTTFDLIILDAFTSDAVPVHLLTAEAFEVYLDRLHPAGVLVANVTNRNVELEGIVAAVAKKVGLKAAIKEDLAVPKPMREAGKTPSRWMVMSRFEATLDGLTDSKGWRAPNVGTLWTDDHASIVAAIMSRRSRQ